MKIGLYGIGLDTYWAQFEGLYDRLQGYQKGIAERLQASDADLQRKGNQLGRHRQSRSGGIWVYI